jgi:hypothetical protein
MRTLLVLASVALLSSCNCGGAANCDPTRGGDAGPQLRTQGEPCTDGWACASGLTCQYNFVGSGFSQQECVASCSDAGVCPTGTACIDNACRTTCTTDPDCTGRFSATCRPVDAGVVRGVCASASCSSRSTCPGSATCITQPYCCPPGAPCAAPQDGFCLR